MCTCNKRFVLLISFLLSVLVLDVVLCYRTYYVPSIRMFVSFKYVVFDERATDIMKESNIEEHKWLRFNFFGKSLLMTRFARPYQDSLDWLAMWPPGEIGNAYVINKQTKEVYISDNNFSMLPILDYHCKQLLINKEPISEDSLFTMDSSSTQTTIINDPYIVIQNSHWLIWHVLTSIPADGVRKAHLWHLFVFQ